MKSWLLIIGGLLFFTVSCDRIDDAPEPIQDRSGTDILSFSLTDGINRYPSFNISDTAIFVSVPNQGDFHKLRAIFTHNGLDVNISGVSQKSNLTVNDYSDFTHPLTYTVISDKGDFKNYSLHLFDIPIVVINTVNNSIIDSKERWFPATMKIIDTEGAVILESEMTIKGRGNGSWTSDIYLKKSYSLKLDKKQSVIDMPKSKRWVLLGTSGDHTKLRTPLCFKLSELAGFEWCPKGQNVELILNGKMLSNYYLCEQIRVEKNRIDIQEMTPSDTIGESLTGGVLFEVSGELDEDYQFVTSKFSMPFMLKSPNDSVTGIQMSYFKSYIDSIETTLLDAEKSVEYLRYLDIDSYLRWWLVNNMCMNREVLYSPKNFYMYRERGYEEKLHAAAPWDFDWGTYWQRLSNQWICKDYHWFKELFKSPIFIDRLKQMWNEIKNNQPKVLQYAEILRKYNHNSVVRDQYLYPVRNDNDENDLEYDEAVDYILDIFKRRMDWLNININELE